jgi:hypothetical protein
MNLSKKGPAVRYVLGLASLLPISTSVVVIAYMTTAVGSKDTVHVEAMIRPMSAALLVSLILGFALAGLFSVDAYKDRSLGTDGRVLWLVGLLAVPPVAVPAYWFARVRHAR